MAADFAITATDLASNVFENIGGSANAMMEKVGGSIGKLGETLGGEFGEILAKVGEGFNYVAEQGNTMGAKMAAAGAVVAGVGLALQVAAGKDIQAQESLKAAIESTGGSVSDYSEDIEKTVKAQENFGHGAADTQAALAKLTESTHDPAKALDNMGVTANLAAAKHEDLASAATTVGKVLDGTGKKVLSEYGITMQNTGNATRDNQKALAELNAVLSGQADAAVTGYTGKLDQMKARAEDLVATMGEKFGNTLSTVGSVLAAVGTVLQVNAARSTAAATASIAHAAGLGAETAATEAATVATAELDVAMDANPVGLVILAIAGLIAGLILLVEHWGAVRDFFVSGIEDIGKAFEWLGGIIEAIWNFFAKIADAIGGFFSGIGNWVSGGSSPAPIVGMATGGIVSSPTLAMVGEAGAEAVIPLSSPAGQSLMNGGGGQGITVNVSGVIGNEAHLTKTIRAALKTTGARGHGFGFA